MSLALDLTYEDVQKKCRNFPLDDVAADVLEMIEFESIALSAVVVQIGVDPETVNSTVHRNLYIISRFIVVLRVTAEIFGDFSHEWGKIAEKRIERAEELERRIIDMPKFFVDGWETTQQMGGWGYADSSELLELENIVTIIGGSWSCMEGA